MWTNCRQVTRSSNTLPAFLAQASWHVIQRLALPWHECRAVRFHAFVRGELFQRHRCTFQHHMTICCKRTGCKLASLSLQLTRSFLHAISGLGWGFFLGIFVCLFSYLFDFRLDGFKRQVGQPVSRSVDPLARRAVSVSRSASPPGSQSVSRSVPVSGSVVRRSASSPVSLSVGASVGMRACRSVSQSGGRSVGPCAKLRQSLSRTVGQSIRQCLRCMVNRYRQLRRRA